MRFAKHVISVRRAETGFCARKEGASDISRTKSAQRD